MRGVAVRVPVSGASFVLLSVEVAQANGEARVICFTAQRGGADGGEGARAQAVGRNDLTL